MPRTKSIRGECQFCHLPFTFPAESIGLTATCPHCGKETELLLALPEPEPALPRRTVILGLAALVIVIVGLVGAMFALNRARSMARERKDSKQVQTNTPANAAPAPVR